MSDAFEDKKRSCCPADKAITVFQRRHVFLCLGVHNNIPRTSCLLPYRPGSCDSEAINMAMVVDLRCSWKLFYTIKVV